MLANISSSKTRPAGLHRHKDPNATRVAPTILLPSDTRPPGNVADSSIYYKIGRPYRAGSKFDECLDVFRAVFLEPFYEYVDEHLDDQQRQELVGQAEDQLDHCSTRHRNRYDLGINSGVLM